jgi:hypothetical protein
VGAACRANSCSDQERHQLVNCGRSSVQHRGQAAVFEVAANASRLASVFTGCRA